MRLLFRSLEEAQALLALLAYTTELYIYLQKTELT